MKMILAALFWTLALAPLEASAEYYAKDIDATTKAFVFKVEIDECFKGGFYLKDPIGQPESGCMFSDPKASRKLLSRGGSPFEVWMSENEVYRIVLDEDTTVIIQSFPDGYKIRTEEPINSKAELRAIITAAAESPQFPSEITVFFKDYTEIMRPPAQSKAAPHEDTSSDTTAICGRSQNDLSS
jgi:hypothetical protein